MSYVAQAYIVMNQTYDTFGEHDPHEEARYTLKEVAAEHARLLNKGWGNRAWVEPLFAEPVVEDITMDEFKEKFDWMYKAYR